VPGYAPAGGPAHQGDPRQQFPLYPQQQYGQPGYQYGQQGYPPSGPRQEEHHTRQGRAEGRTPQRRILLPWLLGGVAAVGVAVLLILGFVVPGYFTNTVFDQNAIQAGVQRILTDEYGQNAIAVRCPPDQQVQQGATFTCTATIDGKLRNVAITVKTSAGEYEVARPS
jgi:hypothetical protein